MKRCKKGKEEKRDFLYFSVLGPEKSAQGSREGPRLLCNKQQRIAEKEKKSKFYLW